MRLGAVAFILLLLFSLAAGMLFVELSYANFFPEQAPSGILIKSDGSVEGTDRFRCEGNVYTFTGDIYRTIVVLRDGIVLDGAGYALEGTGKGAGIFLQERNDVTIKNLKITGFEYGIKFAWLTYGYTEAPKKVNTVIDNSISNNTCGILIGDSSVAKMFSNNRITENVYGVRFSVFGQLSENVLRNNVFTNNQYSISEDSGYANDVDTSNTVNGKPVYYWVNKHDVTVPADAGYVLLKNCSGITVQNLKLSNNGQGIVICDTINSKITGNVLTNNVEGIVLTGSSNNTISGNRVANNVDNGIRLDQHSNNNLVSDNVVESNRKVGISISGSSGITISYNQVVSNGENGIYACIKDSSFVRNNITLNKGYGLILTYEADGNRISENRLENNDFGILIQHSVGNTITENTMIRNIGWAMRLNGSQGNNKIHHNNFIDNNVGEGLQVSMPAIWSFYALGSRDFSNHTVPGKVPDITLGAGNPNSWDDGKEGNYWSDYRTRYPNASGVGNTGVGNTPFFINENNIDYFPLMEPVMIPEVPFEPVTEPSSKPEPIVSPPDNTTLPDQQNDNLVGTGLPVEYAFVITLAIAFIGVAAVITVMLLRKKKLKTKA